MQLRRQRVQVDFSKIPRIDFNKVVIDLQSMAEDELRFLLWQLRWKAQARRKQLAPEGDWDNWGIRSGRGFGKTLSAAQWIGQEAWRDPGSITHVVAPTYDDCRYICFEGPTGLLNVIPPELITSRNQSLPSITLTNGSYVRGFAADTPDRLRGPQCLIAETQITMADGTTKSIIDIQAGDYVQTRSGARCIIRSWKSGNNQSIWRLQTVHGRTVSGTMEHPIWTARGFVPLCQLKINEKLFVSSNLMAESIDRSQANILSGVNESVRDQKESVLEDTYIETSTNFIKDLFQRAISFITEIMIKKTIFQKTWKLLVESIILLIMPQGNYNQSQPNGYVESNCSNDGNKLQFINLNAFNAQSTLRLEDGKNRDSSAIADAEIDGEDRVLSVEKSQTYADVYDLTVEDAHEFFANGVLVHNCHRVWAEEIASWRYPKEAWSNIEFGLRLGAKPQLVWTSTPRPTLFMKERSNDKRTILVLGSSHENRENLTARFYSNIEKYEGTAIGRQEIHGELLDPEEGGFVKRSSWKLWPYVNPMPKFLYIILSLDTAFTDETWDRKKQTGDPTAGSVWGLFMADGKPNIMLLSAWDDHLSYPELVKRVHIEKEKTYGDADEPLLSGPLLDQLKKKQRANHQGRKPDLILIEDKGSGISLRQSLAVENILTEAYNPGAIDKLTRLHVVSPLFAHRRVWVPESKRNPGECSTWANDLISQVCTFVGEGSVEHDDLLDTATQALRVFIAKYFGAFFYTPSKEDRDRDKYRHLEHKTKSNPYE